MGYLCYNTIRNIPTTIDVQKGYIDRREIHPIAYNGRNDFRIPVITQHTTVWKEDVTCGYIERHEDNACKGCFNRYAVGDQLPLFED